MLETFACSCYSMRVLLLINEVFSYRNLIIWSTVVGSGPEAAGAGLGFVLAAGN
jgi:hypothetical protein